MFKNMTEVKKANKAIGHHWFSVPDSHRVSPLVVGRYWIESNAPLQDDGPRRIFAVAAAPNGEVSYLKGADTFDSIAAARAYIDAIIEGR